MHTTTSADTRLEPASGGSITKITAPPPVEPVQFVTPHGKLTRRGREHGPDLEHARQLYRDMVLARRLDMEALALQRQGELGLWLMSLGQEAAQVGSVRALRTEDYVFPTYREHAAALARGIGPADLLRQWRGCAHSGWDPEPYRFHMYTLVLGTQTLHATGYAMGVVRDGAHEVVLCYLGDGASSQGDVSEAMNWAATMSVPVVFFCQNNHWAISTPATVQSRTRLYQRAAGFGLDAYVVDGNDVLAVHAVTSLAADRARSERRPAFIEAETYRMAGHSTADDPGRYRSDIELEEWSARDPLARLKTLLVESATDSTFFEQLEAEAGQLAADVRKACLSLPDPQLQDMFHAVYADADPMLEQQAADYAAYVASFP